MRLVLFLTITTIALAGQFTTSIGDSNPYTVSAITTDAAGNTYIVGSRQLPGGFAAFLGASTITSPAAGSDVFVSKLDPNGKLLFTDTFAGKGVDTGAAIAVDPSGNIYIAGSTTSNDFPLSKALQTQSSPLGTGFIMKLSNDGTTILYSTYFGGTTGPSAISALATDSKGNLYVTGASNASDFPQNSGLPIAKLNNGPSNVTSGAIIAEISAAGDKIIYSGAIAGAAGSGIALDASGNAYIAGNANGNSLSTTPGALASTGRDAFAAKLNVGGTTLDYLTYLSTDQTTSVGGIMEAVSNVLNAIAVDAAGNAYLTGTTDDPNFPTTPGSLQPTYGAPPLAGFGFLAKLNPSGSALVWATYLGEFEASAFPPFTGTFPRSISIDAAGDVWVGGTSGSFPNTNGWSTGTDFLVGLNSTGSKLTYSALYPAGTVGQSVAVDPSGLAHVAGVNGFISAISPTSPPPTEIFAFQNAFGGNVTGRISPAEVVAIFGPGIGPATAVSAAPVNGLYPTTLAGAQVTISGADTPLLYVSANQINAVVPMELATNSGATVRVINGTTVSPDYPVWIAPSEAAALPTVINQDGSINSQTNPAHSGSIVTFYATGWQSSFSPLVDGQVATAAENVCAPGACSVSPGITTAEVLYAGAAPGIVAGATQFNVKISYSNAASPGAVTQASINLINPTLTETVWITP